MKRLPIYKHGFIATCITLLFIIACHGGALCQAAVPPEKDSTGKLTSKELTIPENPVFDLMGVTPAQVTRMSDIKDFKVDWSFKSWKLNPNIAVEGQPVWELLYNRKNLHKYQQAGGFMRMLSTLDVSGGTIQSETGDRRIGMAAKLTLYRQKDPLLMKDYYTDIAAIADSERAILKEELNTLTQRADTTKNIVLRHNLNNDILTITQRIADINTREKDEIRNRAKLIISENWNASSLNIAVGKVFTYTTDSSGNLKKLLLTRNTALGFWINGGIGIGRKVLLTGLIRSSYYEELLQFTLQDENNGELSQAEAVAKNTLISTGANIRFGGSIFSFFTEFIYERKGIRTASQALAKVFDAPNGKQVINSTVHWDVVQPYTITFGGDWRVSRNVLLSFGIRSVFNKNFKNTALVPVATVGCMMR